MLKVVLDTNVLVSALLSRHGPPARLVAAWLEGRFELVVSPALLDELAAVLRRPKLRRRILEADAAELITAIRRFAIVHADPSPGEPLTPDPGDDFLVRLARAADASVIVSGDRQVASLDPPVVDPRSFLDALPE